MPEPVTFQASIEKPNCTKLNPDGDGTLILTFPESEFESVAALTRKFCRKPLFVTVVLRGDVVEGKKAE